MKKRITAIILLLALSALLFSACSKETYDFVDKSYIYAKLVNDGAFVITINEDGTFSYSESSVSGSNSAGTWTYDDGILTLTNALDEENTLVNMFLIEDGTLVFIADGSTNLSEATFSDGDKFYDMSAQKAE